MLCGWSCCCQASQPARSRGTWLKRLGSSGWAQAAASGGLDYLVTGQSVMLATNQLFMILAVILGIAALSIWLAPRPARVVDTSAVH